MNQNDLITANIDPLSFQQYFEGIRFPISQEDLMQVVRGNNAPDNVIEQMEEMMRSDSFESMDQLFNELGGFYTDGDAQSVEDGESGNY